MSKVYKCDSCDLVIENPYEEKMKEFYVDVGYECGIAVPLNSVRKVKVHLCNKCFHGLKEIGVEAIKSSRRRI